MQMFINGVKLPNGLVHPIQVKGRALISDDGFVVGCIVNAEYTPIGDSRLNLLIEAHAEQIQAIIDASIDKDNAII